MFQAYQHYFNMKERVDNNKISSSYAQATINPAPSSGIIRVGNHARRGYRPLTTAGSSGGGYRHHHTNVSA
jgi:hypothetical protein